MSGRWCRPRTGGAVRLDPETHGLRRAQVEPVPQALLPLRALVYDTAAALLNRVGEPSLAWTAADRAMTAAEYSGEPLLAALAAWRLSYIITGRKHPREGLELAMAAAGTLEHAMRRRHADGRKGRCRGRHQAAGVLPVRPTAEAAVAREGLE